MNEKFFDLSSEKQDRIINAAIKVFALNSYKHSSTDLIVREAGISKGLLFHYFEDKQTLFAFILDFSVKYILMEFNRAVAPKQDYFDYYRKLAGARMNIMEVYPYMCYMMDETLEQLTATGGTKDSGDRDARVLETISEYETGMDELRAKILPPPVREGIPVEKLDRLMNIIIKSLTEDFIMDCPDSILDRGLSNQICGYLDMLQMAMTS